MELWITDDFEKSIIERINSSNDLDTKRFFEELLKDYRSSIGGKSIE
jgi:hypothetical protein